MTYNIKMIKGNTETIRIVCNDRNLEHADVISLNIKKSKDDNECIIKKYAKFSSENIAEITLYPTDTKNLPDGQYVYDIQFNGYDGYVQTIFKGDFYLDWRVAND